MFCTHFDLSKIFKLFIRDLIKKIIFSNSESKTLKKISKSGKKTFMETNRCLPNYIFLNKIGAGNFSTVRLGVHRLTQKKVAIKLINKKNVKRKQFKDLYREMYNMRILNHPNIIRLIEFKETPFELIIVSEYVNGGELFHHISKKGRMKENSAREKFRQLVSAVYYCHSKGIVHRDLKAENILLDSHNNLVLVDFGFSNRFDWKKKMTTYCGSPQYAAPELFVGNGYIGPEVDVWSLGVILYVILTASLPFNGGNVNDLKISILEGRYRCPYYISNEAENLIKCILINDPNKRANMETIIDHPWINKGFERYHLSCFEFPPIDYNKKSNIEYIKSMELYNENDIINTLDNQSYNDIMALYLLLDNERFDSNIVNKHSHYSGNGIIRKNDSKDYRGFFKHVYDRLKNLFKHESTDDPHKHIKRFLSLRTNSKKDSMVKSLSGPINQEKKSFISSRASRPSFESVYQPVEGKIHSLSISKIFSRGKRDKNYQKSKSQGSLKNTEILIVKKHPSKIISKSRERIIEKLMQVLSMLDVNYTKIGSGRLKCEYSYVPEMANFMSCKLEFEAETIKMFMKPGYYQLQFKFIRGAFKVYSDIINQIERYIYP